MLKKFFLSSVIFILLFSCTSKQENVKSDNSDIPIFTVAEFNMSAAKYVGKEVIVKGIADHICKHGGKRLLLVSDNYDLHVDSDKRFNEDLVGKEIAVRGIVKELRIDEAYLLKMEEDNIQKHKKGETNEDFFAQKKKQIEEYRAEMKEKGVDHLSFYSLDYISHTLNK